MKYAICVAALLMLVLLGDVGLWHELTGKIASKMAKVAGISEQFSVRIEDFKIKCWLNGTYCLTHDRELAADASGRTIIYVDAYADWGAKEIVFTNYGKNSIGLIAHEVAHMKLNSEGTPSLMNESWQHDREDFLCWSRCLALSYMQGYDVCGVCRA